MFFKIILFLFFIIFNFETTYANDDLLCNVELEKINHLEIPDIYKFNLLKINFIEKSKSKWEISDISLDNNLISNAK